MLQEKLHTIYCFEWLSVIGLLLGNLSLNRNVRLINAFGKVGAKYGFKELI